MPSKLGGAGLASAERRATAAKEIPVLVESLPDNCIPGLKIAVAPVANNGLGTEGSETCCAWSRSGDCPIESAVISIRAPEELHEGTPAPKARVEQRTPFQGGVLAPAAKCCRVAGVNACKRFLELVREELEAFVFLVDCLLDGDHAVRRRAVDGGSSGRRFTPFGWYAVRAAIK